MILLVPVFAVIFACGEADESAQQGSKPSQDDLAILVDWMSGYFTRADQAREDSAYFNIALHMKPIWRERSDAHWLYVEQAVAENADSPYRQRVYRVSRLSDLTFESAVYTMEDPQRFAGAWKDSMPLQQLRPDSLTLREGCSIILREVEGRFIGSTVGKECSSDLRGASYATSEVVITEDKLISWDRGFDESGKQVWGAEQGGYVFRKIKDY